MTKVEIIDKVNCVHANYGGQPLEFSSSISVDPKLFKTAAPFEVLQTSPRIP